MGNIQVMNTLNALFAKKLENGNFYLCPSIIFAIQITLKGDQTAAPTKYMNNYFYGEEDGAIASSGKFKYLPLDKEQQNDQFFVDSENPSYKNLLNDIYTARVNLINGNTEISIMINCEILESVDDELQALSIDLNNFVNQDYALSWEQVDLNNILLTPEEDEVALSEGWCLIKSNETPATYQIKNPESADKYEYKKAAWDFVINRAVSGSILHHKAITLIKLTSPDEFTLNVEDADVKEFDDLDGLKKFIVLPVNDASPWFLHYPNGDVAWFDSEDAVCTAQRKYRTAVCLDPMTGR
jgi:hypothetical protein